MEIGGEPVRRDRRRRQEDSRPVGEKTVSDYRDRGVAHYGTLLLTRDPGQPSKPREARQETHRKGKGKSDAASCSRKKKRSSGKSLRLGRESTKGKGAKERSHTEGGNGGELKKKGENLWYQSRIPRGETQVRGDRAVMGESLILNEL